MRNTVCSSVSIAGFWRGQESGIGWRGEGKGGDFFWRQDPRKTRGVADVAGEGRESSTHEGPRPSGAGEARRGSVCVMSTARVLLCVLLCVLFMMAAAAVDPRPEAEGEEDGGGTRAWDEGVRYGRSRQLLSDLTVKHSAVHAAAVAHAAHKRASRARHGSAAKALETTADTAAPVSHVGSSGSTQLAPSGVSLPTIPKKPPVCSVPPSMRFCKIIDYPVYRPDQDHTFDELDFDSHAVFKKIVPHMRISERHFELPAIHQCRSNFRKFLCLRNFPRCCHVGLCSKYGDSNDPLTTASLSRMPDENLKKRKATTVTFLAGSRDKMRVEKGLNDTVQVKVADATCLQYEQTYAPLFDCRSQCHQLLSDDCLFMLSQECSELCMGVHTETCATKALYQMATGKSTAGRVGPQAATLGSTLAVILLVVANAIRP